MEQRLPVLMITDDLQQSELIIESADYADHFYLTAVCETFEQAMHTIRQTRPLAFLLELNTIDGQAASLLYYLHNSLAWCPYIVIVSHLQAPTANEKVRLNGAARLYLADAPDYSAKQVVTDLDRSVKTLPLIFSSIVPPPSFSEEVVRANLSAILTSISIPPKLLGHKYLIDAVILHLQHPNYHITREIYETLATRYETTAKNIDRCMRTAIEMSWRDTDMSVLKKVYPNSNSVMHDRPTVKEFVCCVADSVCRRSSCCAEHIPAVSGFLPFRWQ